MKKWVIAGIATVAEDSRAAAVCDDDQGLGGYRFHCYSCIGVAGV